MTYIRSRSGSFCRHPGDGRGSFTQERATADLQAPPYLTFALAAAAVAVGSAKAITASPDGVYVSVVFV